MENVTDIRPDKKEVDSDDFEAVQKKNKAKKERLEAERRKTNKNVLRSYKIKTDDI